MKLEGGKRLLGNCDLKSSTAEPVVSVITVVYNSVGLLEKTIKNVLSQTYKNIELIVIDGGSNDGTLDIINKYNNEISYWLSEKDKGLYDAMDKGLQVATGDYVWYINSGDLIANENTTANVFNKISTLPDIIYGDTEYVNNNYQTIGLRSIITNKIPPITLTVNSFKYGMVICHQSIIVKRKIAARYDLSFRYVSDFDWVIASTKNGIHFINANMVLSKFLTDGFSTHHRKASIKEKYKVLIKHWGFFIGTFNYVLNIFKATISFLQKRKYVKQYGIQ